MFKKNEFSDIYDKFYLYSSNVKFKFKINELKIDSIKKEIQALHLELYQDIAKYYFSFNSVVSKKVLERKIINMILYLIFKNNYDYFKEIKESDSIRNIIIKELKNINKYLEKAEGEGVEKLKDKISKQINYYESKNNLTANPKNIGLFFRKSNSDNNYNIIFNKYEKELLNNYALKNFDNDSYSTIFENPNKIGVVEPKKLRIIAEFLFYIRDKTINIIHILELNTTCFFSLLNDQNINEKLNIDVNINNNDTFNNDNNLVYEKNINKISIEENNKVVFEKLKVDSRGSIKCKNAFNFIFSTSVDFNLNSKIEYLYNNIKLPIKEDNNNVNNKVNSNINELDNMEYDYDYIFPILKRYKNEIEEIYTLLDEKFKQDPSYDSIQKYFQSLSNKYKNSKISVKEPIINVYKNNVENFEDYENFFSLMKLYGDYDEIIPNKTKRDKMIKECNDLLQKLEKYNYIKKNINKYLVNNNNIKEYKEYYKEWKRKNKDLALKGYTLKNLLEDIQKLIPMDEDMKISGRDKFNFTFILYLFQQQYFLKDYI